MRLFVPDSVDEESWSPESGNPEERAIRQEQYYHYVADELIPLIRSHYGKEMLPFVTGVSMGANHAAIMFLRRPALFSGMLALSGVYDSDYFFHGWMNPVLYDNSPERFLPNMAADHPYIGLYNQNRKVWYPEKLKREQNLAATEICKNWIGGNPACWRGKGSPIRNSGGYTREIMMRQFRTKTT